MMQIDLDGRYSYASSGGSDSVCYVLDTGIRLDHEEFQGRAIFGFKAVDGWSSTDRHGHGTHVAAIVGGKTFGMAKSVRLVSVKVLSDSGSGCTAFLLAGLNYAVNAHSAAASERPHGIINLSLGIATSRALDQAVSQAVASGLIVVAAAGNENEDTCHISPGGNGDVISVGATTIISENGKRTDVRPVYSNYGPCVTIMAPGSMIRSAWARSAHASIELSGTSMAAPHVSGAVALLWESHPDLDPHQVRTPRLLISA